MAVISLEKIDKYTLVNIVGDLQSGLANDANLRDVVDKEIKNGNYKFVINLERAVSPCTSFVGAVVEINKRLKKVDGYLGIIKPWQSVDVLRAANIYCSVESFYNLDQFKQQKIHKY